MSDRPEDVEVEGVDQMDHLADKLRGQKVDIQDHVWIQRGYELIDNCGTCPRQGVRIPYGKVLTGERGSYKLVDEMAARV